MTTQFQTRSEQPPSLWIDRTATPPARPEYDPQYDQQYDQQYDRRSIGVGVNAHRLWGGGGGRAAPGGRAWGRGSPCCPAAGCSPCPCWPRTRTATAPCRPRP